MRVVLVAVVLVLVLALCAARTPRVKRGSSPSSPRTAKKKKSPKSRFQGARNAAAMPDAHGPRLLPSDNLAPLGQKMSGGNSRIKKSLVIVGADETLGSRIAKDAIGRGRHQVFGITSSLSKAQDIYSMEELLNIQLFEGTLSSNHTRNMNLLGDIFRAARAEIVVEVVSDDLRPDSIDDILQAAAKQKVPMVVVRGGSGQLYANASWPKDEEGLRVGLAEGAPESLAAETKLHMAVQEKAFGYSTNFVIPSVFQITPPDLVDRKQSAAKYELAYDVVAEGAPTVASYGDMSSVFLDAVEKPTESNLKMVGLAPKKRAPPRTAQKAASPKRRSSKSRSSERRAATQPEGTCDPHSPTCIA